MNKDEFISYCEELGIVISEELYKKLYDYFVMLNEWNEKFNMTTILEEKDEIIDMVEINIKYEGYIKKTQNEVNKMLKLEEKQIPEDIDYEKVRNIATEARQKFSKIRPLTIGQASRISGVNPSDITMLLVYLKKEYNNE